MVLFLKRKKLLLPREGFVSLLEHERKEKGKDAHEEAWENTSKKCLPPLYRKKRGPWERGVSHPGGGKKKRLTKRKNEARRP